MGDAKVNGLQRYDIESSEFGCNYECTARLVPRKDGDVVMYADHAAATAEARERIKELEAEVERLRVLRPWAEPFAPTIMLAVEKAFSIAELMHSRDVQLLLDEQMRAMVVSMRIALAKEVRP